MLIIASGLTCSLLFLTFKFQKWFGMRKTLVFGFLIMAAGCVITFIANDNFIAIMIGMVLRGLGQLPTLAFLAPLI
jgi:cyanate permease